MGIMEQKLCGFSVRELVQFAYMMHDNPTLVDVKNAYIDGYRKGYEYAQKEFEEAAKRAFSTIRFDGFPFISMDGGIDLNEEPMPKEEGTADKPF